MLLPMTLFHRMSSLSYWFVDVSCIFFIGFSCGHVSLQLDSTNLSSFSNLVHGVLRGNKVSLIFFFFACNVSF